MWERSRVLITGGTGMVARFIKSELERKYNVDVYMPARSELDLENKSAVHRYFSELGPTYVFHLAGKVCGLGGNLMYPLDLLASNVLINDSVLTACAVDSVKKIFFAGTVASYGFPFYALPLEEKNLFEGVPHGGEYGYAVAKRLAYSYLRILNEKYGKKFVYGVYTNLYGPYDRFNSVSGHVIPSLIDKVFHAREKKCVFEVWGRPDVTRDFLYVEDAANAAINLMETSDDIVNIGSGLESSMGQVVEAIVRISGFEGEVRWNSSQPTGITRRYSCVKKLASIGFQAQNNLDVGLSKTWEWYCRAMANGEGVRS